jgi:hypothetical protein
VFIKPRSSYQKHRLGDYLVVAMHRSDLPRRDPKTEYLLGDLHQHDS